MPRTFACVLFTSAFFASLLGAEESAVSYENLEILPDDVSQDDLLAAMLENLRGLGLPRLEGRGCLYCHVGDLDRPRSEWDWASDEKPMKHKARKMMAMVAAINRDHLGSLESRTAPAFRVTCATCHAGRTDPRPLTDVLADAYQEGGVEALTARYETLRDKYFGADAYDFRPRVLSRFAVGVADRGALAAAEAIAAMNVEKNPGAAAAKQTWVRLVLERLVTAEDAQAAIRELDRLAPTLAADVLTPGLLDTLGWRLHRSDRPDAAMAFFRHNRDRFPDAYVPQESVAFALDEAGDLAAAIQVLEAWLVRHPDHDRARRLVVNLRSSP